MTRIMYDSATVGVAYPPDAQMLAGYIDGYYQTYTDMVARYPNLIHIPITVWPSTNDGICLDVENGDATPDQAPAWVTMRRAAGVQYPWVYCSYAAWDTVINAFVNQSVEPPLYWIAAYPGIGAEIYPNSIGHQYGGTNPWDISVMLDTIPGIDSTPTPTPTPTPIPEDDMAQTKAFIVSFPSKQGLAAIYCREDTKLGNCSTWVQGGDETLVSAKLNAYYASGVLNLISSNVDSGIFNEYPIIKGTPDPRK